MSDSSSIECLLDAGRQMLGVYDRERQQRLLESEGVGLLMPVFCGHELNPVVRTIEADGNGSSVSFGAEGVTDFRLDVTVRPELDAVDLRCSFTAAQDLTLNRLDILPAGTKLNFYNCINFRNRHGTEETWPELLLARKGLSLIHI